MEVKIFAYDERIILDDIYDYVSNHDGLFSDVIAKITYLETNNGRGTGKNYKSLKKGVGGTEGVNVCEIKASGPGNEQLRIFYYSKYNEVILILDRMPKPEIYTTTKEQKKVNKEYDKKIDNCISLINEFYNGQFVEGKDYINFNKYLKEIGY